MRWLILLLALALPHPSRAEGIVVMPVKFLDTSKEATDQSAAHLDRIAILTQVLTEDIGATALSSQDIATACPKETPECLLAAAKAAGAQTAIFIVVHKSSSLIMQAFVQVLDVDQQHVLFKRDLNFRGDNDEAWRRAGIFMAHQFTKTPTTPAK
ncbi:DUF2380 domain-containing protein [Paracoccus aminophilus]|uniref:DUF2380 domain-containing protein n=1 Tax=Paracoccus aminophilus JCM 7686 TaxID=1367847 RepID=S5YCU2_PARAH|nr:DUF2380 domain-containing protein [Paracoccus aminophilus]AGT09278.1 hypothetical protein JCM7686_2199 [Paracoccus aminophilus JCM 7686]